MLLSDLILSVQWARCRRRTAALIIFGPLLVARSRRQLGIRGRCTYGGSCLVIAMGRGLFAPPLGSASTGGRGGPALIGGVPIEVTVKQNDEKYIGPALPLPHGHRLRCRAVTLMLPRSLAYDRLSARGFAIRRPSPVSAGRAVCAKDSQKKPPVPSPDGGRG